MLISGEGSYHLLPVKTYLSVKADKCSFGGEVLKQLWFDSKPLIKDLRPPECGERRHQCPQLPFLGRRGCPATQRSRCASVCCERTIFCRPEGEVTMERRSSSSRVRWSRATCRKVALHTRLCYSLMYSGEVLIKAKKNKQTIKACCLLPQCMLGYPLLNLCSY